MKDALRLRFLAFHGCGARFTVLLRDRPDPSEAGGFVAGELERVGGAGGGGDSGTALSLRFRSAAREKKTTAASARRASPSPRSTRSTARRS